MERTKQRPRVSERPDKQLLDRRPTRKPEEAKDKGRRWFPWIASLVVIGIAATALVVYLVGGREGTATYETSFNYELASMMVVEPAVAGPINTLGATYDPLTGGVVFPNADRSESPGPRVESSAGYYNPAEGGWVPPLTEEVAPINTTGATYDPVAGTVIYPNAG